MSIARLVSEVPWNLLDAAHNSYGYEVVERKMVKHGTIGKRKWRKWNRGVLYRNKCMISHIIRLVCIATLHLVYTLGVLEVEQARLKQK